MDESLFTRDAPGHLEPIMEGVNAFVPDPLPPPIASFDPSSCAEISEQSALAIGGLGRLVESITSGRMLIDSFLRREAIRSSTIEGTQTQLRELLLFEVGENVQDTIDSEDAAQVLRNLSSLHRGLELVEAGPLIGRVLREAHSVLFSDDSRILKRPGEYRTGLTRIGGRNLENVRDSFLDARFVPPPASHVQQAMKDLEEFINLREKHRHLPVLVRAALMHYQFETIHPFADGNGRIGRLAVTLLLKAHGLMPQPILCLSAYMDEHREEYTDRMLAVSQRGEWTEWVRFFLRGVKEQANDDIKRCKRLMNLRQTYLELSDQKKVPVALVDYLFGYPALTIPMAAKLMGTTYQPGKRCVEALQESGVLQEVTGRATNRVYLARQIIDLLEKPLADVDGP